MISLNNEKTFRDRGSGFFLTGNAYAFPSWLQSKALQICKSNQDIDLTMNWKQDDGTWEAEPINIKKDDYISIHKKKKNNDKWYVTSDNAFPLKNTDWDRVEIDKKYERVKCWIPIVCEKGKNGLRYIPGSHKKKFRYSF